MTQPKNKITNDLNYLSDLGYEAFPGAEADVSELKKQFRARNLDSSNANNYFFTLVIGIALGITLFFTIYNSHTLFPSHTEKPVTENALATNQPILLDTISVGSAKKTSEPTQQDKFIEPKDVAPAEITEQAETLEPIQTNALSSETSTEDNKLKYAPNAPIIYLHDLKIANYHLNYFSSQKNILLPSGIPAEFTSKNDATNQTRGLNRNYYLHNAIDDAMRNFKNQRYKECISLLNTIQEFNATDINCVFYKGMSFYYLQNYKEAYSNFKLAQANAINVFKEETDFYLALSMQKSGKNDEFKQLLGEIVANKGYYAQKAKDVLALGDK